MDIKEKIWYEICILLNTSKIHTHTKSTKIVTHKKTYPQ